MLLGELVAMILYVAFFTENLKLSAMDQNLPLAKGKILMLPLLNTMFQI